MAQIYIDDDDLSDALDEMMGKVRVMNDIVVDKIPNSNKAANLAQGKDYTKTHFDFIEAHKNVRKVLSEFINPEVLEEMEPDYGTESTTEVSTETET